MKSGELASTVIVSFPEGVDEILKDPPADWPIELLDAYFKNELTPEQTAKIEEAFRKHAPLRELCAEAPRIKAEMDEAFRRGLVI